MIRNTLVIAVLMGLCEVEAIDLQSQMKKETKDVTDNEPGQLENVLEEYETESLPAEEFTNVQTSATVSKECKWGIKRFTHGKDNSWSTFNAAHASGAGKFKDTGFPAVQSSLVPASKWLRNTKWGNQIKSRVKTWKRPNEMGYTDGKPSLWGPTGKPEPWGVAQRGLGDCWFLAAASAIAEVSPRIKRVVWNEKYDDKGAFRFFFWVKNKWHGVNVDDQLPVKSWGSQYRTFATSRSDKGAWWMPLMEKAYAKLDQNYERIIAGMGYEGLRTLTAMPTKYINYNKGKDAEGLWKKMLPLAKRNYPMTTACCHYGGQGSGGLVSGHAYTLLDMKELSTGVKLAKVRNPWSSERYKGDYSDHSSKWTKKTKKEVNLKPGNDGSFWLPWTTYTKYYWGASVNYYQAYKGYKQFDVSQKGRTGKWSVTNPVAQELYMMGETYSNRNYPRTCNPNNNYVLYLFDKNNKQVGKYGFIGWTGFGFQGNEFGTKLPAGTYTLYLINQASSRGQTADVTLSFYWKDKEGAVKTAS